MTRTIKEYEDAANCDILPWPEGPAFIIEEDGGGFAWAGLIDDGSVWVYAGHDDSPLCPLGRGFPAMSREAAIALLGCLPLAGGPDAIDAALIKAGFDVSGKFGKKAQ